jgi:hypothetical protein
MKIINGRLTPRLLSLLALGLHHSKTEPSSPAYYVKTLQTLLPKSKKSPSDHGPTKTAPADKNSEIKFISIRLEGPPVEVQFKPGFGMISSYKS